MDNAASIALGEVQRRLQELKRELTTGEEQLTVLDRRRAEIRETMLRIAGAIQVLEEILRATTGQIETHSSEGQSNGSARSSLPAAESAVGPTTDDGLQPRAFTG